ncbi:MAG TPA: hypothetical protein VFF73_20470 [Planctomycetota bacterium]|nr:hypothetical protein [Planctomycetota bacterium]
MVAAILLGLAGTVVAEDKLASEDRELLESLLKTTVFDPPANAERVVAKVALRTCWASTEEVERELWRVPASGDQPARLVRADGRTETAAITSVAPTRVDFVAAVRERLEPPKAGEENRDQVFAEMARVAGHGAQTDHDLAVAAWLHRRGEDGLAVALLEKLRAVKRQGEGAEPSLADRLREELAWQDFAAMVHAYMVRADAEALAEGEHLFAHYPEQAKHYDQAKTIVAELERRKKKGSFGLTPPERPPEELARKSAEERIAWLVTALEDVDARQWGQPGGVDLGGDWRVSALIDEGDCAVPALIDAVEKDERLTRCVHFWRDFARSRTVLSVREAALTAVMSILRFSVFEPRGTGDNFTASEPERAREVAKKLRAYWEKNRGLKIEERMVAVLMDTSAGQKQCREAAQNLAELNQRRRIGTTVWGTRTEAGKEGAENPALALAKPTAAEAILAAMDRDVALGDPSWKDDARMSLFNGRKVETHYIQCLVVLGDRRICPELRRRAEKATEMRMRRQWAFACHVLGDPEPMAAFWREFAKGALEVPPIVDPGARGHLHEEPGAVELRECVETAVRLGTHDADDAIRAVTNPDHPYHDRYKLLVTRPVTTWDTEGLFWHPYYLAFIAPDLEQTEETGTTFRVEGDMIHEEGVRGSSWSRIDSSTFARAALESHATERRCDRAAARLSEVLVGLPRYSVLLKDRDARLAEVKSGCKRFLRRARRATPEEQEVLGVGRPDWEKPAFLPGITSLGRVATEKDVAEGNAIFHLGGEGQLVDLKLPAVARLKRDGGRTVPVLVVQAEQLASGARHYGVVGADCIQEVSADRLESIEPLPKRPPEKGR